MAPCGRGGHEVPIRTAAAEDGGAVLMATHETQPAAFADFVIDIENLDLLKATVC